MAVKGNGMPGKGYEPRDVPENPHGSRWLLDHTPVGWPVEPRRNAAECFAVLAGQTAASVPRFEQPTVTVVVKWASASGIRERGAVTLRQVKESLRPGKLGKVKHLRGGALLDSLALGGEAFEKATDHECYAALAEYAVEVGLTGQPLRTWNDALARLLAARAGVELAANADVFRFGAPS